MSQNLNKENFKEYTTDGRVKHLSTEDDINDKLGKIIGDKFIQYRKKWDAVNRMEIITDFPMFLQLKTSWAPLAERGARIKHYRMVK